jgi:uncharacterized phage infection (PIP) family protein YhgE
MNPLEVELKKKDKIIDELKEELKKKDNIIKELAQKLGEIEKSLKQFDDLELKLKTKDDLIENQKKSLNLKEDQIKTLKDSMNLKNEQIKTLETSINIKDEKIRAMEKSIEFKERDLKALTLSSVDRNVLIEKDTQIKTLNEKIKALGDELKTIDEDLDALEHENETLRTKLTSLSGTKILDWTNIEIPKSEILEKMRAIIMNALQNVTIAVPDIKDLQQLYLYEVRTSVNMRISCSIDPDFEEDAELLEEFESLDNISIRLYEGGDRFVLERDGEELLLAVKGVNENNHLILHTKDQKHIKFYRAIVMDSWLRARKIE